MTDLAAATTQAPSNGWTQPPGQSGTPETSYDITPTVTLTPAQIAANGYEAGFTDPSDLATFLEVVQTQSGGHPGAFGLGTPGSGDSEYSVGLTQENIAAGGPATGLLTPLNNAIAAHNKFASRGWQPWESYGGESSSQVAADLANNPSANPAESIAAANVAASSSPATLKNLVAQSGQETLNDVAYAPPYIVGTTDYPSALKVPGPDAQQGALAILADTNIQAKLGTTPATGGSATQPTSTLTGFGGLLQQLDHLLNTAWHPGGTTASIASLGTADIFGYVELVAVRLAFALPGVIGLLVSAGVGIIGAFKDGGAGTAAKVAVAAA